jgi:hypothetical protein
MRQKTRLEKGKSRMKLRFLGYGALAFLLTSGSFPEKSLSLDGHWRAVWKSSGGDIPVDMYLKTGPLGRLEAEVHNGSEIVKFSRVERTNRQIDFFISRFESQISAELAEDGTSMAGKWAKQTGSPNSMPFYAVKEEAQRFPGKEYPPPAVKAPMANISGIWKLKFEGDDHDSMGMFQQDGERLTGTIRAVDGDFRALEGVYRNGLLLLSSYNGSWVFLFRAEMDNKGALNGYWARGPREPIKWTATRETVSYPDTFHLTKLTNREGLLRFKYPLSEDPERLMSNSEPEFKGKPLLVALSTTGCPNSHQNAELLSALYREYQPKGLNMLFINFEMTKDVPKIQARIKRFKEEYGLPIPVLFSLAMDKKEVGQEIPDFEKFLAWPTVVFYGADGKVKAIHTGIDGPATGEYYVQMVGKYRQIIEDLLSGGAR